MREVYFFYTSTVRVLCAIKNMHSLHSLLSASAEVPVRFSEKHPAHG